MLIACSKKEVPSCESCNFTCLGPIESDVITNNCKDNWSCEFVVIPKAQVDLISGVSDGSKIVFRMINETEGDSGIADDEFTNTLVFELDEFQNSFSVADEELALMRMYYRVVCFCSETDFMPVTSGCLQGEKGIDGLWNVQGNIIVSYEYGDVNVKVDAVFED